MGGPYTLAAGPANDFDVNGAEGLMNVMAPNTRRSAHLNNVSVRDLDAAFRVKTDKASVGGGQIAFLVVRRQGIGTEYLLRARFPTDGSVRLQAERYDAGSKQLLGSEYYVVGLKHSANVYIRLRAQVFGINPTTIRMKAWADNAVEPTNWQFRVTDSTSSLQQPGVLGLRSFLGGSATNAPVLFSFDDLLVKSTSPTGVTMMQSTNAELAASASEPDWFQSLQALWDGLIGLLARPNETALLQSQP